VDETVDMKSSSNDDVYLTRHGARIDSDDLDWLKKCNHNRADDPHLSPRGHIGAQELAQRLKEEELSGDNQIKHIISSPYFRCIETANAIAQKLNIQIKIEPGIAEVNSHRNPQFLDTDQLQKQFPSIDATYEPVMTREELPLEYSDGACAHRSASVARKVRTQLTGAILFVGHGASCLGIAGEFGHSGYIGYTSLTKFIQHDGGKYRLDGLFGDVSHLSDQQTALDSAW
jgi:broad specificity phosphatase PhoE